MRFYLGTHRPNWLWDERMAFGPLFLSHRQLGKRVTPYPRATVAYGVDSGAFTEMHTHGRWVTTPEQYVEALYRYRDELGSFEFAGQQDLMCEPFIFDRVEEETGRRSTVLEHQERTVENFLRLRQLAPDLPMAPTLQGWTSDDYLRAVDLFTSAGVDLRAEDRVGVGSVCRRQSSNEIARVFSLLHPLGLRLHGYGVKAEGLENIGWALASSDSLAWSRCGRWRKPDLHRPCQWKTCANCAEYALAWHAQVLRPALLRPSQLALAV